MVGVFLEQKIISGFMLFFLVFSVVLKIVMGVLYNHLIKETENMASTNNKLLRQCKARFTNCYELNHGMSNVPVFVDKFIHKLSLGPFSFRTIYYLSGQMMILSVILSGVLICMNLANGRSMYKTIPFYLVSFVGLYLYFSVSSAIDLKTKKTVLRINMIDYLENHLSQRIYTAKEDMKMLYGDDLSETISEKKKDIELMKFRTSEEKGEKDSKIDENTTWDEIESLLKEILIY